MIERMRKTFDAQNATLLRKAAEEDVKGGIEPAVPNPSATEVQNMIDGFEHDWNVLQAKYLRLEVQPQTQVTGTKNRDGNGGDFVMGFHPWDTNSVGHLHMHVFPRGGEFRKWSARRHDWKTVEVGDVWAVQEGEEKK